MRLIDADTLIEKKWQAESEACFYALEDVVSVTDIDEAPTIEVPKWIPCSERLPKEERETYWVCTDTKYQCECRWTNNVYGLRESDRWGWSKMDYPQFSKVVAWMPLPKPYEGTDHE